MLGEQQKQRCSVSERIHINLHSVPLTHQDLQLQKAVERVKLTQDIVSCYCHYLGFKMLEQ